MSAFGLFLSPIPTYRKIVEAKDVQSFSALPAITQLVESTFWLLWAISVGDRNEVVACNLLGVSSQLVYVIIFACYTPKKRFPLLALQLSFALVIILSGLCVW